ncbi:SMP-30/gluconolactonase/LRE family protein [Phenylobacterium sp.]|uniref:SMP-30/gluconolactonase/LRE family protein n=1 Tax=Phenylobacterium sp. TaxID=1871053 RepID=UPI0025F811A0|nr:SMP-30/gluconolactonase/LRE family protein [Phenylobacterium sp.]
MTKASEVVCVVDSASRLGEGPCWSAEEGRLYWFDIKGRTLNWYEPVTGQSRSANLQVRASAAAVCRHGGLLVATDQGLAHWNPADEALRIVTPFDFAPGYRTNDGKIDPSGCFWWSTMDDDGGCRPGTLYRTDPEGVTEVILDDLHIPNTVSFSADGKTLYLADSQLKTLYACDPQNPLGRTVFADTRDEAATPDGGAIDAEGCLWNAQWGGWRVVRYARDGRIDRMIPMPIEQPTSCAFGGPDLATLFVTSAWDGLTEDARRSQPLAGGVFALQPGVAGLPLPLYDGPIIDQEPPHG